MYLELYVQICKQNSRNENIWFCLKNISLIVSIATCDNENQNSFLSWMSRYVKREIERAGIWYQAR